jgi:phosphoribosylglycinamide formyltransferase-1
MNMAVLVSGSGTNLQALLDAAARGDLGPARLVVVGSNVPGCAALARAERAGVPSFALDHRSFSDRQAFDQALLARLEPFAVEAVVLAGFMRLLSSPFLRTFAGRVINIHPALLPAFAGVNAQRRAFEHGVKVAGCTVHFVDEGTDSGPIIAQAAVPVLPDDDEERLRLRILAEEHRLLPAAVRALAEGRLRVTGRRVEVVLQEGRS